MQERVGSRRLAVQVFASLTAAVLLVWATSSGPVSLLTGHGPDLSAPTLTPRTDVPATATDPPRKARSAGELPPWIDQVLIGLGLLVLLVLAWFLVRLLWRGRYRRQRPPNSAPDEAPSQESATTTVSASLADRHQDLLATLSTGHPRNAIVACWLDLEETVARSGVRADPALTSSELTERVLGALDVDQTNVLTLARLYREARFSEHPLDETHRVAAAHAIHLLHADLGGSLSVTANSGAS